MKSISKFFSLLMFILLALSIGLQDVQPVAAEDPSDQTITLLTHAPASAAYAESFTVEATASSGLDVVYSALGACTNVGAIFTMSSGGGNCTVQYDQAGDGAYNPAAQVTEDVAAQPADITVTADAKSKTEGDTDPALTYTITDGALVGADAFSGALTRDPGEAVGDYAITQGTLTLSDNYTLTYVGTNLTITATATEVLETSTPTASPTDAPATDAPTATATQAALTPTATPTKPRLKIESVGPGLFVSALGSDQSGANACANAASPCHTIQQAITKATSGDTIYVTSDIFNGAGATPIVTITKNLSISGGWDSGFNIQSSLTILDGQDTRSNMMVNSGVTATIEKFVVTNSHASGIKNLGTLTVQYSMIYNNDKPDGGNLSASDGGGIYNSGTLVVTNSSIYGNYANLHGGGGIFNTGSLTVRNSTIANNNAHDGGGIIYTPTGYAGTSPSVVLNNVTLSGNYAIYGSSIYRAADIAPVFLQDPILYNTIFANNNNSCYGTLTSANNNVIYQSSGCTISGSYATSNPLLGAFSTANGYFPLLHGSPAIDAGSPATPGSGAGACETVDQLGTIRPTDGDGNAVAVCDIGAYEADPSVAGVAPVANAIDINGGSLQSAELSDAFPIQLSALVNDQFGNPISGITVTFTAPASGASGTFGDSGTNSTTAVTAANGIATAAVFTASGGVGSYLVNASVSGIPNLVRFRLTNTNAVTDIDITAGSQQSAAISTAFQNLLKVLVKDQSGDPMSGVTVTFTAPASGASGIFGSSGTNTTTVTTDENGVAQTSIFTANAIAGNYTVSASVPSGPSPVQLQLANVTKLEWYVAPNGDDLNACTISTAPCLTISAAMSKALGDHTIKIASGTYTNPGGNVVAIDKSITLLGGWDETFTQQNGMSTLDGQGAHTVINIWYSVTPPLNFTADHLIIQHGNNYSGGGIQNYKNNLIINNSIVRDNIATNADGGGIASYQGPITLNNTIVTGNRSGDACCSGGGGGAGIHINGGPLVLNNSTISANTLMGGFEGAGIYNLVGTVILNNSTVSLNVGGNAIFSAGNLTLNNSTVNDNESVGIAKSDEADAILNNSTVTGNATGILGCTNHSGCTGQMILKNSIVAGNNRDCTGTIVSGGYNLIGDITGCGFSPISGDLTNVNAGLGPLVGLPEYIPLLPGSPAINAGNPATCLATDQRGVTRPQNGVCDIGAYEYATPGSAAGIVVIAGTSQRAGPGIKFLEPLKVAVLDNQGSPINGAIVTFAAPVSGASGTFINSGTNITTAITDTNDIAMVDTFTANGNSGSYLVSATVSGVAASADFMLTNLGWFVAPTGNDANSCDSAATACLTINAALGKTAEGDPIYVAQGTYYGTGNTVVSIVKSVRISGGWNTGFTVQNGMSIIDGQKARRGIYLQSDTMIPVMLDHFIIQNSYSSSGGGIRNSGAALTLDHSIVRYNLSDSSGAGIYNATGQLTINDTAITENTLSDYIYYHSGGGGGIYNNSVVILNNSSISRNMITNTIYSNATDGSGIYNKGYTALNNSTVSGNTDTRKNKAGIYNHGSMNLNYSTVSNHVHGVNADFQYIILQNSILAGNTQDCQGTIISLGYNLIGNTNGCTFSPMVGDLTNINAKLGRLIGFSGYLPLLSGSPAINKGNPVSCFATDQRGVTRPRGARCDIGSYEYTVPGPAVSIGYADGSNQATISSTIYSIPLTAYAVDSLGSPVQGVTFTFTAPTSGPSGKFANHTSTTTAVTDVNGLAVASAFAANNAPGSYNVSANANGISSLVTFTLTNLPVPIALSPSGTITSLKPAYQWTKLIGATAYQYELWEGATLVFSKNVAASVCGSTTCSTMSPYTLKHFSYKWRVRAMVGGVWQNFSAYKSFVTSIQPGLWHQPSLEFYVAPNLANVSQFSLYVSVTGCGYYKITNYKLAAINNNRFGFTGSFYAKGIFIDPLHASGSVGLRYFHITGCGYLVGGPFPWKITWKNSSQPAAVITAEVMPLLIEPPLLGTASQDDYFTVERVSP